MPARQAEQGQRGAPALLLLPMRLVTLADGRAARLEGDHYLPLPGRVVDHLLRPPASPSGRAVPIQNTPLLAPIPRPGKVVCVGLNYRDHAAETGATLPERPMLFSKAATCVVGPGRQIEMPWTDPNDDGAPDIQLDFEAELAVIIGAVGRNLTEAQAPSVIGGYACFNDVSERVAQKGDGQFFRGKSFDTFGPLGPFLTTPDEIDDPQRLPIRCLVNDEVRQDSNTSEMIFGVHHVVAFCSQAFTLEPGDVIATGTPSGVGAGDGHFLKRGDIVTVTVEGLGSLTNHVV